MPEIQRLQYKKSSTPGFILGILFFGIFFLVGVSNASAAPIKILNNSNHAYHAIGYAINALLGRPHTSSEFIIDFTTSPSYSCAASTGGTTYFASLSVAVATSSSVAYCNSLNATTTPSIPYQIFSTSFSGNPGDSLTTYNNFASYDFTDDYAFTASPTIKMPPAFYTAPGNDNFASAPGVEWKWDKTIYDGRSLSGDTAANTGFMAWLRLNHPTWNWYDVKAATRQSAANWATGYNSANYGFGLINATTTNALTDGQVLLQPTEVATSTSGISRQITFSVFPFKQTRRVKEVLFQFSSSPGFQANELTLAQIQALGGTKITEYSGTLATTTAPIYSAVTNAYFVWFTADNATDGSASFSRIDTYNVLGPLSQSDVPFASTFDLNTPANNGIASSTSPTFTWNAAQSAHSISKYQLFIDDALDTDNISGTSVTTSSILSEGTHTWYVKAFNGNGTATTSVSTRTVNVISGYAPGHTFYVDNVLGDNNGVGSQAAPWASITKAANTAQAGDTVIIIKNASQPYRETFTSQAGNSTDGSITFRGVDVNSKPEIWGSTDISSGWSVYGGGNPNTYQQAITAYPYVVAAGPSIGELSLRTPQASNNPNALAPGEWAWSGTFYYRLASGEDINTLHIEVAQRNTAIVGRGYNTFKDLIVKYANSTAVSLLGRSIAERIEVYDSYTGVSLSGSGSSENSPGPTLRYSIAVGNSGCGISLSVPSYARVYNNISYGNDTGICVQLWAHSSIFRNNIFNNNTSYDVNFSTFGIPSTNFVASHNNWSGTVNSYWQDTYQGTNNQALAPLLTDAVNRNFRLQQFSPNIDAGTDVGLTTDILGNPIYGAPDLGGYEHQPPYSITTSGIPIGGSFRVYKDGKYQMTAATSSTATANMVVAPSGGFPSADYSEWLNVTVNTWNISGDYAKSWTESSSAATSTAHTIGDLAPNGFYAVSVDGVRYAQFRADSGGQGTFTYSGGYSTHTFTIAQDLSIGNGPPVGFFGSVNTQPIPAPATIVLDPRSDLKAPQGRTLTTSTMASSTSPTATTTPPIPSLAATIPDPSSPVITKEKIIELQGKLIVLLKQLVVLLTEQLQNITKTI